MKDLNCDRAPRHETTLSAVEGVCGRGQGVCCVRAGEASVCSAPPGQNTLLVGESGVCLSGGLKSGSGVHNTHRSVAQSLWTPLLFGSLC